MLVFEFPATSVASANCGRLAFWPAAHPPPGLSQYPKLGLPKLSSRDQLAVPAERLNPTSTVKSSRAKRVPTGVSRRKSDPFPATHAVRSTEMLTSVTVSAERDQTLLHGLVPLPTSMSN